MSTSQPSQALLLFTEILKLPSPEHTWKILTFFHSVYASPFLSRHPGPETLLDPEYPQINLRFSLPGLNHLQHGTDMTSHAVRFIYTVIEYLARLRCGKVEEMLRDEYLLREAHKVLCILQSVWLGRSDWLVGGGEEEVEVEVWEAMEGLVVLFGEMDGSG